MKVKPKVFEYPGEDSTVYWHGGLCIHIAECGRAKGELFVGGRQPWCQPDCATSAEVDEVVRRCPSGALTAEFKDDSLVESAEPENTVQVTYNGPLFVRGDLDIEGAPDSAPAVRFRAALCRCGQSANKPFCDNSHSKAGFEDFGAVGEAGSAAAAEGGSLSITGIKDGPLKLEGNFSILASSGRKAWLGQRAFLCRCGASENKPFCDGQHKKVGFTSD